MRGLPIAFSCLVLLTACGHHDDNQNTAAPVNFVPPTALDRADFTEMVEHRFTQLDTNHDSVLTAKELPARHHDIIAAFDRNGDGKITRSEFEQGSLARFDRADINDDQVLTGEERRTAEIGDSDAEANAAAAAPAASPANAR